MQFNSKKEKRNQKIEHQDIDRQLSMASTRGLAVFQSMGCGMTSASV